MTTAASDNKTTAIATKPAWDSLAPAQKMSTLHETVKKFKSQVLEAYPSQKSLTRVLSSVTEIVQTNPKLLDAKPESIAMAIIRVGHLGLDLDQRLGLAYMVPYKGKDGKASVQVQISYRGMIVLARRAGDVMDVFAECVYQGDHYLPVKGIEPRVDHIPLIDGSNKQDDKLLAVYGVIVFRSGYRKLEIFDRGDVMKRKARSKQSDFGPWKTDEPEMWKKTVIRHMLKYVELSVDDRRKMESAEADDEAPHFDPVTGEVTGETPPQPGAGLDAIIEAEGEMA